MAKKFIDESLISRLEIINHNNKDQPKGKLLVMHDLKHIELSVQDGKRTLKIFV